MRRAILIPLFITIAILAIVGGLGYFIYNNYYYYRTDDAQVYGQLVNVNAATTGTLNTLSVKLGDRVAAGQTIGSVTESVPATSGAARTVDLTSPIDGTVIQVAAAQGQVVTPGLVVAQVTNLSRLNVVAYVDERVLNNLKVDQSVDISIDAYPSTSYTGHVQQIVGATASQFSLLPTTDYASGNFTKVGQRVPVLISLDNNGNYLTPGMSAEVTIHLH